MVLLVLLAGCGRHRQPQVKNVPAPPPPGSPAPTPSPTPEPSATKAASPTPSVKADTEPRLPKDAKVLYREVGWASWYGPHFQSRQAANGELFDTEQMTAAHRTLPLNSIARVTNVKTGDSVLLRITDRGPFVVDRVIDLSRAAARRLSVYQRGTALVRIEVLQSPSPIFSGGRWCVQIGPFTDAPDATQLKDELSRRNKNLRILMFASPTGPLWLRVRVADDDKRHAEELMRGTRTDAEMYLVRMD